MEQFLLVASICRWTSALEPEDATPPNWFRSTPVLLGAPRPTVSRPWDAGGAWFPRERKAASLDPRGLLGALPVGSLSEAAALPLPGHSNPQAGQAGASRHLHRGLNRPRPPCKQRWLERATAIVSRSCADRAPGSVLCLKRVSVLRCENLLASTVDPERPPPRRRPCRLRRRRCAEHSVAPGVPTQGAGKSTPGLRYRL